MIQFYNRKTKAYETEKVAGDSYLKWIYSSPVGMTLLELFVKRKIFSKLYGMYCDSALSKKKISSFISEFDIDMNDYADNADSFKNFNEFFYRKTNPLARPIDNSSEVVVSPGDGRIFTYDNIDLNNLVQVKGMTYSFSELINEPSIATKYDGGVCMVLRLCPTDYHRFHFIDGGICGKTTKINGSYYSVNPIALNKKAQLYCQNKREWSILNSDNLGDVLYLEVGATCVGSIVQTYTPGNRIEKGEEKGYFKFGGSTVILFFEKDKIIVDKDILDHTAAGFETKISFGEKIGIKF